MAEVGTRPPDPREAAERIEAFMEARGQLESGERDRFYVCNGRPLLMSDLRSVLAEWLAVRAQLAEANAELKMIDKELIGLMRSLDSHVSIDDVHRELAKLRAALSGGDPTNDSNLQD